MSGPHKRPQRLSAAWALTEVAILASSPGPTQQLTGSNAGMLQARQPAGWEQTHLSADSMPKAILTPIATYKHTLDIALPMRGTRPSSNHSGQAPAPLTRKPPRSLRTSRTHQRVDTGNMRSCDPPASGKESQTQKISKMRSQEICFRRRDEANQMNSFKKR